MRATQHSSRTDSKGRVHGRKHNDRNFDVSKSNNIDPERTCANWYWNCYEGEYIEADKSDMMTFDEVEIKVYEEFFGKQLEATNSNYLRQGHPNRVRTMKEWIRQRNHAPEEVVIQVGSLDQMPDWDVARKCLLDYVDKLMDWNKDHGSPMVILDVALHMDESVPHVQIRRTWVWDDNGNLRHGQERALEAAGVPLPDPGKVPGRWNNRKQSFDAMMREQWLDICEEHGLTVERDPLPGARHNRDKEDMIRDKYAWILEETDRLLAENAEMGVSAAVMRAMAEVTMDFSKKIPFTDLIAVREEDYETLQRRAEGYEAAKQDAVQLRHDMDLDRFSAQREIEKARREAKNIIQRAREEAGRITCEAILDQQKLDRYERLEKRFPEIFREMEEDLKKDKSRSRMDKSRDR